MKSLSQWYRPTPGWPPLVVHTLVARFDIRSGLFLAAGLKWKLHRQKLNDKSIPTTANLSLTIDLLFCIVNYPTQIVAFLRNCVVPFHNSRQILFEQIKYKCFLASIGTMVIKIWLGKEFLYTARWFQLPFQVIVDFGNQSLNLRPNVEQLSFVVLVIFAL